MNEPAREQGVKVQELRAFIRWASLGGEPRKRLLLAAVEQLSAIPLREGFNYKGRAFDSSGPPAYAVNLERASAHGTTDYIHIGFDKRHHLRFSVLFGSKETSPPHAWVRAGSLVWKKGLDDVKYKVWGARWWHAVKTKAFSDSVLQSSELMQQVVRYLDSGDVGDHVEVSMPAANPASDAGSSLEM